MSDAFELEICQGKYRYRYEAGKQEVWRNGEPWEVMNGRLIGDKFVFSLAVELDEAIKERDALRAKVEAMEQQEPAGTLHDDGCFVWRETAPHQSNYAGWRMVLYALPGAQAATSVPDGTAVQTAARILNIDLIRQRDALRAKIEQMKRQEPTHWSCNVLQADASWKEEVGREIPPDGYYSIRDIKPLYALPGAQTVPNFADAYQGAMEEVAIWKKRALEAEDLNRKFVAEINGPTHMGEPAQPAPSVPDGWKLVPIEPTQEMIDHVIDERLDALAAGKDHTFIDIYKAMLAAAPEAKP